MECGLRFGIRIESDFRVNMPDATSCFTNYAVPHPARYALHSGFYQRGLIPIYYVDSDTGA